MEYPHERYLLYLLSQQPEAEWEVQEQCSDLSLLPPSQGYTRKLLKQLGDEPANWQPKWTRGNVEFRRWLRDRGLETLWRGGQAVQDAMKLCLLEAMREDAESLFLLHGNDAETVREMLVLKYPERTVPSEEALQVFYDTFWAVAEMPHRALWNFLEMRDHSDKIQAAAEGDKSALYGVLGIVEKVSTTEALDNIIALMNHQMVQARRSVKAIAGNQLVGLAAIGRLGVEAIDRREEINQLTDDGEDDLKKAANQFRLGRIRQRRPILSLDELQALESMDDEDRQAASAIEVAPNPAEEEMNNVREFRGK